MHLITTVCTTVVRTRECVCVSERQDVSLVSCACEGECAAVLIPLISDLLPSILL